MVLQPFNSEHRERDPQISQENTLEIAQPNRMVNPVQDDDGIIREAVIGDFLRNAKVVAEWQRQDPNLCRIIECLMERNSTSSGNAVRTVTRDELGSRQATVESGISNNPVSSSSDSTDNSAALSLQPSSLAPGVHPCPRVVSVGDAEQGIGMDEEVLEDSLLDQEKRDNGSEEDGQERIQSAQYSAVVTSGTMAQVGVVFDPL